MIDMNKIEKIIKKLKDPEDGCPWDNETNPCFPLAIPNRRSL